MIDSHSTMYLLKQDRDGAGGHRLQEFTFHHVSIKTNLRKIAIPAPTTFTFHHVSIKTSLALHQHTSHNQNSHSTMYLLKPAGSNERINKISNSHSTMYLLKQQQEQRLSECC